MGLSSPWNLEERTENRGFAIKKGGSVSCQFIWDKGNEQIDPIQTTTEDWFWRTHKRHQKAKASHARGLKKTSEIEANANSFDELAAEFISTAKKLASGRTQTVLLAKGKIILHENKL